MNTELRRENTTNPNAPADLLSAVPGVLYTRPAGGWSTLAPPVFGYTLPITQTLPEGARFFVRAVATDPQGAKVSCTRSWKLPGWKKSRRRLTAS